MTKYWKKIYSWKKNCGLNKERPSYRRSLQLSKENIQHFKTWNFFYFFSTFVGHFCPEPCSKLWRCSVSRYLMSESSPPMGAWTSEAVADEEKGAGALRTGDAPAAAAAAAGDTFPCDCGELLKKDRMEVWPFDADAEERRNRLAAGELAESKHRIRYRSQCS